MFKGFKLMFKALKLLYKALGQVFQALEHKMHWGEKKNPSLTKLFSPLSRSFFSSGILTLLYLRNALCYI